MAELKLPSIIVMGFRFSDMFALSCSHKILWHVSKLWGGDRMFDTVFTEALYCTLTRIVQLNVQIICLVRHYPFQYYPSSYALISQEAPFFQFFQP
jgi:hypothetical protein